MTAASPEASQFYLERDSRTDCYVTGRDYRRARVLLSLAGEEAQTASGQVAFLLAANLLSRWCRWIGMRAPRVPVHPAAAPLLRVHGSDLLEAAVGTARAADPYGVFDIAVEDADFEHHLHVGARDKAKGYPVLGRGWLGLAGDAAQPDSQGNEVLVGAILAACLGTAAMFRASLGIDSPRSVRLSLWNLRGGVEALQGPSGSIGEIGKTYLIGCGAVGSGMAYLLPVTKLKARLTVVDGDRVETSNLNRSPLFLAGDVRAAKATVTTSYLTRSGYDVRAHTLWFDEAMKGGCLFDDAPDLVIPTANDRGVRHLLQHQLPPVQVYGTTGRDWTAFLGRHVPLVDDCLACRFPVESSPPELACSTGRIAETPVASTSRDAALPFLSTAAAALAVAELLKMALFSLHVPNFACVDFRGDLTDLFSDRRRPRTGCTCAGDGRVWSRIRRGTRFARLSFASSKEAQREGESLVSMAK